MVIATCHCRAVSIELDTLPTDINECHCSICWRYGARWAYYDRSDVRIVHAAHTTELYCWGDRNIAFHRCRTCGCVTQWVDTDPNMSRMGINTRMIDPADLTGVPVRQSSGPTTKRCKTP